jgi:hypothetical protein
MRKFIGSVIMIIGIIVINTSTFWGLIIAAVGLIVGGYKLIWIVIMLIASLFGACFDDSSW